MARHIYLIIALLWVAIGALMWLVTFDALQEGGRPFLPIIGGALWVIGSGTAVALILDARRRL